MDIMTMIIIIINNQFLQYKVRLKKFAFVQPTGGDHSLVVDGDCEKLGLRAGCADGRLVVYAGWCGSSGHDPCDHHPHRHSPHSQSPTISVENNAWIIIRLLHRHPYIDIARHFLVKICSWRNAQFKQTKCQKNYSNDCGIPCKHSQDNGYEHIISIKVKIVPKLGKPTNWMAYWETVATPLLPCAKPSTCHSNWPLRSYKILQAVQVTASDPTLYIPCWRQVPGVSPLPGFSWAADLWVPGSEPAGWSRSAAPAQPQPVCAATVTAAPTVAATTAIAVAVAPGRISSTTMTAREEMGILLTLLMLETEYFRGQYHACWCTGF